MLYITLRQEQTEIIESSRPVEDLIDMISGTCDLSQITKNTRVPWDQLITEETILAAARSDVVYFAKNGLNNIIITDGFLNKETTLINFLRDEIYDYVDDDDDAYKVLYTTRHTDQTGSLKVEDL